MFDLVSFHCQCRTIGQSWVNGPLKIGLNAMNRRGGYYFSTKSLVGYTSHTNVPAISLNESSLKIKINFRLSRGEQSMEKEEVLRRLRVVYKVSHGSSQLLPPLQAKQFSRLVLGRAKANVERTWNQFWFNLFQIPMLGLICWIKQQLLL